MYDYNINIILYDLPNTIGGFTLYCDDFYTIVLNQNLSYERNQKTLRHELFHIQNGDFQSNTSLSEIEYNAHFFS